MLHIDTLLNSFTKLLLDQKIKSTEELQRELDELTQEDWHLNK